MVGLGGVEGLGIAGFGSLDLFECRVLTSHGPNPADAHDREWLRGRGAVPNERRLTTDD